MESGQQLRRRASDDGEESDEPWHRTEGQQMRTILPRMHFITLFQSRADPFLCLCVL